MLVSLGVMTWIVSGTQFAIHNKEIMFVEKGRSIVGCPKNITFKNPRNFSGYVEKLKIIYFGSAASFNNVIPLFMSFE